MWTLQIITPEETALNSQLMEAKSEQVCQHEWDYTLALEGEGGGGGKVGPKTANLT